MSYAVMYRIYLHVPKKENFPFLTQKDYQGNDDLKLFVRFKERSFSSRDVLSVIKLTSLQSEQHL